MQLIINTAFLLSLLWPPTDLIESSYKSGPDLGDLAKVHHYGSDDFCYVQSRPLYSGEVDGLPLYEIFYDELTDLVGFEFRKLYYNQAPYNIPGCTPPNTPSCTAPLNYDYEGYTISITEEEKFLFEIWKDTPRQTIYY